MKYQVTTKATVEPITLDEARKHLRVEPFGYPLVHPDDDYIQVAITSAREWCENYLQKALATQTVTVKLSEFADKIELPLSPVQSVTSVTYLDRSNVLQTLSTSIYYVDYFDNAIYLEPGQYYPPVSFRENSITIQYVSGYTGTTGVNVLPSPIKSAMFLLIGSAYENRQEDYASSTKVTFNSLPMGVYNLLQSYRLNLGV